MIKIRKIEGGDVFDLPPGYVIEAEKNNPLFSNKGSQTVPVNFPSNCKNNRLLDFPFRIDRTWKKEETIPVIVETGSVQQKGLLSINSASDKIISANIGYDESEMYAVMKDMQLRELPILNHPQYSQSFGGDNVDQKIDSMLAHLTAVMKAEMEEEYCLFPIIVKREDYTTEVLNDDGTVTSNVNKTWLEIINEVDTDWEVDNVLNPNYSELKAIQNRIITRYENSQEIQLSAPKGYGVSPFLKVYRILEIIFENFDFTITENPFKDHRQLKKLVVLNNTIDAVLTGCLYYKDLMPDCSIQEFLDALHAKFGMLYFVDSNSKTIRIKFLKDLVNAADVSGAIDLNKMKTEEPAISFSSTKQLRLKMNRELEDAKVPFETMEEFLERFLNQFTETPHYNFNTDKNTQLFVTENSTYYIENVFTAFTEEGMQTDKSSDFFDWDKKTENLDYEDIEMKDLCLPLYTYQSFHKYNQYLVGFKHLYSDVFIGGSQQEATGDPAKMAFVFAWGIYYSTDNGKFFFASQFNRDRYGNFMKDEQGVKYDISLTCNREDGLYNRFWKEYDAFIRHSNQQVACNLHLSDKDFIDFKMDEKIFINNQPVIAEQIKYKFNDQKNQISESTFRTLRLFKPFDLEAEQEIAAYQPQKYYWAFSVHPDGEEPSKYVSVTTGYDSFFTINGVQVPVSYMSNLPPTEDQYHSEETRNFRYWKIFKFKDTTGLLTFTKTIHYDVTFKPALI